MADINVIPNEDEIMKLKSVPTDYPINRLTTLKRVNTCYNGVALEMRYVKISENQSESRSNLRNEVPGKWYLAPSSYVKLVTDGKIIDNVISKFTTRDVVKSHSMDIEHNILPYELLSKYIQCSIRSLDRFTICRKVGSNTGVLNLNMIMGLFAKHDAFKAFYDDYITDLDTNVSLFDEDYDENLVPKKYYTKYEVVLDEKDIPAATAKVQKEESKKQVVKLSNMISTYLMAVIKNDGVQNMGTAQTTPKLEDLALEFLVMMVVISSCKTYVSLDHLRKYFENRGSPFSQVFAASNFNFNDLLNKQIVIEDYQNLAQKMNYFPRLKVSIFRYIITVPGLMCNYVRKMIRNAQASVFQVAMDNEGKYPHIAEIIKNNFYVDDLMYGASDEITAIKIKNQLSSILEESGFHLRKWSSNSIKFLEKTILRIGKTKYKRSSHTPAVKTLGLYWDTKTDVFRYSICIPELKQILQNATYYRLFQKYLTLMDG